MLFKFMLIKSDFKSLPAVNRTPTILAIVILFIHN